MRKVWTLVPMIAALASAAGPAGAQVRTIDPNQAIDADLAPQQRPAPPPPAQSSADFQRYPDAPAQAEPPRQDDRDRAPVRQDGGVSRDGGVAADGGSARAAANTDAGTGQTFAEQDLLRAAEATFGRGAAGLAGILERTLKEQGRPNAYISGREAAGAVVVGLRYGKGTLYHKVEGEQPVYWTGPSLGFDLGGDATKVFVLAYNLYDSEELYRRFPAAEGRLYFVGGFAATYLRRGNIVLIPIRLGVGWRQGVNVGYMKFSHKSKWMPF